MAGAVPPIHGGDSQWRLIVKELSLDAQGFVLLRNQTAVVNFYDEQEVRAGFDSMEDGRARFTPHAAFEDHTAPSFAPARESIEARALVFYGPEPNA
jgi:hypothetical protein